MKKNTKTNLLKMAAILIVITIISNVFIGYRLTPESAVKAVRFYPAEAPVILLNERINSNPIMDIIQHLTGLIFRGTQLKEVWEMQVHLKC